jgi:hypothetical protein
MNRKKNWITAQDLMARLQADPKWVAAREQEEEVRQKASAEFRRLEAPLVEELRAAGFQVESAWDFVNTSAPYPEALPILLRHLQRPYPGQIREGIARALGVQEAKFG